MIIVAKTTVPMWSDFAVESLNDGGRNDRTTAAILRVNEAFVFHVSL